MSRGGSLHTLVILRSTSYIKVKRQEITGEYILALTIVNKSTTLAYLSLFYHYQRNGIKLRHKLNYLLCLSFCTRYRNKLNKEGNRGSRDFRPIFRSLKL